ncbi:POZ domain-containing protein [Eremomyces bilateralis CBS 781.70]|uniref:Elongin-C n=1 Tax=Eremomyces bilateralis CBS 781.70 TaxID=1392243 RepID=A0A6G1G8X6_9PEZI|nr:POZ domain-containing protein [Eremomyces bilateralis CBS 781.70]KAF1814350.1 POZ domain-containing protein [Eremomyces bilateralis CBS 781.70]
MSEPTEYVTLVSYDGFEFKIRRSAAIISGAIRRMLDPQSNFAEARTNRCTLETIPGIVLEKVCEYLYYNEKFADSKDVPDMEIPADIAMDLLIASDFLDV